MDPTNGCSTNPCRRKHPTPSERFSSRQATSVEKARLLPGQPPSMHRLFSVESIISWRAPFWVVGNTFKPVSPSSPLPPRQTTSLAHPLLRQHPCLLVLITPLLRIDVNNFLFLSSHHLFGRLFRGDRCFNKLRPRFWLFCDNCD